MVLLTSTDGKCLWGVGEDAQEALEDAQAHTFHDNHPYTIGADKGLMEIVVSIPSRFAEQIEA